MQLQIEDSLITTNNQLQEAVSLLQEINEEHKAYEQILTDPDVLADYTCEFFGPEGPYPVEEEPGTGQVVGNQGITPQQQAAALQQQQAAAAQAQQIQDLHVLKCQFLHSHKLRRTQVNSGITLEL